MNERDFLSDCRTVQKVAGRDIVHRIDDEIAAPCYPVDTVLCDPFRDRLNADQRVQGGKLIRNGCGFRPPDVPAPVEDLTVQVARLNDVAVDDPQMADAGGGQVEGDDRAQSPGSGNENTGRFEPFLPLFAERQHLAGVSLPFFIRNHGVISYLKVLRSGKRFLSAGDPTELSEGNYIFVVPF